MTYREAVLEVLTMLGWLGLTLVIAVLVGAGIAMLRGWVEYRASQFWGTKKRKKR